MDTDAATLARLTDLVRALPPAERLARALALSALARQLAWQGARAHVREDGAAAVLDRFLRQLYGPELAARITAPRPGSRR